MSPGLGLDVKTAPRSQASSRGAALWVVPLYTLGWATAHRALRCWKPGGPSPTPAYPSPPGIISADRPNARAKSLGPCPSGLVAHARQSCLMDSDRQHLALNRRSTDLCLHPTPAGRAASVDRVRNSWHGGLLLATVRAKRAAAPRQSYFVQANVIPRPPTQRAHPAWAPLPHMSDPAPFVPGPP